MSSYQVIARRFRPVQFAEVVGQEHVTRVIEGAIKSERVAHAYLFCGPRGVGKTSTARILARALNCSKSSKPTPTPCNSCQICEEITAGRNLDTIEIDGASTRGIDNVRELRESARYSPAGGRYKVYVIDEVHMLTTEAFNALLKTLEEPPGHVVFIFATTEVQKVPATILSRCQRFDFRLLKVTEIADQLEAIVKVEKFKIDRAALMVVARRGQGSMRDAESLLDQVLVAVEKKKKVTREMVEQLLGLTSTETFFEISDCLQRQDAAGALQVLTQSLAAGNHLEEMMGGLIDHLRNLMLLAVSAKLAPATGLGDDVIERCQEQLEGWSRGDLARMLEIAAAAAGQMRRSDFPQLHLEMALVQMAELPSTTDLKHLIARLDAGSGGSGGSGGVGGCEGGGESGGAALGGTTRSGPATRGSAGPRSRGGTRPPARRRGEGAAGAIPSAIPGGVAGGAADEVPGGVAGGAADEVPGGVAGGVPGGVPGGVTGGVPGGTMSPTGPSPPGSMTMPVVSMASPTVSTSMPAPLPGTSMDDAAWQAGLPTASASSPASGLVAVAEPLAPTGALAERVTDVAAVGALAPEAPVAEAPPGDVATGWARILERLKGRKAYLASLLSESQPPRLQGGVFRLAFDSDQAFHRDQVADARNRDLVVEELRIEFGAGTRFEVVHEAPDMSAEPAAPAPPPKVPLQYTGEVEGLLNRFDGVILPESEAGQPRVSESRGTRKPGWLE